MLTKKSFIQKGKKAICGVIALSMLAVSAPMFMAGCGNADNKAGTEHQQAAETKEITAETATDYMSDIHDAFIKKMSASSSRWSNTSIESVYFGERKSDGKKTIAIIYRGNHSNTGNETKYGIWEMAEVRVENKALEYINRPESAFGFNSSDMIKNNNSFFQGGKYNITKIS